MKRRVPAPLAALLAVAVAAAAPGAFAGSRGELVVAAVQLHVDAASLRSPQTYEALLLGAAARAARGRPVDLIVFPEYTAALFALATEGEALASAATAAELLERLRASDPTLRAPADFFAARADAAAAWSREVFGWMAREHRAWVVAGTSFEPDGAGGLRNRVLVFGPGGELAYTQDKVFVTDVEAELLGMSGGDMAAASGFRVAGRDVRITVCRDTFERAWEERHRGADLWMDIKANGTAFTRQERESFQRALPARLGPAGVRWGLTVCLTGRLLEFVWEGESSSLEAGLDGVRTLERTASPSQAGSLLLRVPAKGQ